MTTKPQRKAGDGDLDCETYLRPRLEAVVKLGLRAGWSRAEIANAFLSLAQSYVMGDREEAIVVAPASEPRRSVH